MLMDQRKRNTDNVLMNGPYPQANECTARNQLAALGSHPKIPTLKTKAPNVPNAGTNLVRCAEGLFTTVAIAHQTAA
jgi:hypothetical protein